MDQISKEREAEQRAAAKEFTDMVDGIVKLYNKAEALGLVMRFNIVPNDGKFGVKKWKAENVGVETKPVDLLSL